MRRLFSAGRPSPRPVPQPARGVHRSPWKSPQGFSVLVAFTSRGVRFAEVVLVPGLAETDAERALLVLLDHVDPLSRVSERPRLTLVRGGRR